MEIDELVRRRGGFLKRMPDVFGVSIQALDRLERTVKKNEGRSAMLFVSGSHKSSFWSYKWRQGWF